MERITGFSQMGDHGLYLNQRGEVYSYGRGDMGQLGNGLLTDSDNLIKVAIPKTVFVPFMNPLVVLKATNRTRALRALSSLVLVPFFELRQVLRRDVDDQVRLADAQRRERGRRLRGSA